MIVTNNICEPYKDQSSILMDLSNAVTIELIELGNAIENAIDFKASEKQDRPVISYGLDEALDESKMLSNAIFMHSCGFYIYVIDPSLFFNSFFFC